MLDDREMVACRRHVQRYHLPVENQTKSPPAQNRQALDGANVSQAARVGMATGMVSRQQERWVAENQDALESSNGFVEQHGLPLAHYQQP